MATKTIPKTSDRKTQKRINWANKTRELLAEALDSSVLKLIDGGITGLEGSPNLSMATEGVMTITGSNKGPEGSVLEQAEVM